MIDFEKGYHNNDIIINIDTKLNDQMYRFQEHLSIAEASQIYLQLRKLLQEALIPKQ